MVRRVGFGGEQPPNKRDNDLRRRYHKTDGNHSDRAHAPQVEKTISPAPITQEKLARPEKPKRTPVLLYIIAGFFVLPFIFSFLGGLIGGRISFIGMIFIVVIAVNIFKFIKKSAR